MQKFLDDSEEQHCAEKTNWETVSKSSFTKVFACVCERENVYAMSSCLSEINSCGSSTRKVKIDF